MLASSAVCYFVGQQSSGGSDAWQACGVCATRSRSGCRILILKEKDRLGSSGYAGLDAWYASGFGMRLALAETAQLATLLPTLFGWHAVTLGAPAGPDWLAASRIGHRLCIAAGPGRGDVRADPRALPLRPDSVDLVLVPHLHEFIARPEQLFDGIGTALIPDGRVIVLGFNPLLDGGLWRLLRVPEARLPAGARLYGSAVVRGWLRRAGFETDAVRFHCRWPWDGLGRLRGWPMALGACGYLIIGRKRVSTLTPVRPRWRPRRRLLPAGAVGDASRVGQCCEERSD